MAGQAPSVAEVERIAALGNPVIRNLQITQYYHELSRAMQARTGPHANWCTFAIWASKQAGQTIRKEDLARALEQALTTEPDTMRATAVVVREAWPDRTPRDWLAMQRVAWDALNPLAALNRASDAVARGNLKVFAEIGREFARFAVACLDDATYDAEHLDRFCDGLRPGDPPDGQRYLRQAFTRYYSALFEPESRARAELMLLANLEIGLHEQTRLQPQITEALDAWWVKPGPFTRRLLGALFPHRGWLVYAGLRCMRLLRRPSRLDNAIRQLVALVQQRVRAFVTEQLMVLCFPNEVRLRLGDDLRAAFPDVLIHLANADLLDLLSRIDPTPDSLEQTGAVDWADLPDRLHYIADLFRCYQVTADLSLPPFTPEQVAALKAGQMPVGRL